MKIRAITLFLQCKNWASVVPRVTEAAAAALELAEAFKAQGYEVQTTRIAMNSFEEYLPPVDTDPAACIACVQELADALEALQVDFFNLGPAKTAAGRALIVPMLKISPRLSATCQCADHGGVESPPVEEERSSSSAAAAAARSATKSDHTLLIDEAAINDAASVMIRLGKETDGGYGNFRFCATFGCPPGIAFFPAAYAGDEAEEGGAIPFALGLECGDLALSALTAAAQTLQQSAKDEARPEAASASASASASVGGGGRRQRQRLPLSLVRSAVRESFEAALVPLEAHAMAAAEAVGGAAKAGGKGGRVTYSGIDASLNPGLAKEYSVAEAMEVALGSLEGCEEEEAEEENGRGGEGEERAPPTYAFGSGGTLAVASALTSAVKDLPVKLVGYSGLMLPPLEDSTLARRQAGHSGADEARETSRSSSSSSSSYGITDLLAYSAVCGVGLDTVPIPGDTPHRDVAAILLDTAALASRWRKPLSARLFPVPGKKAGDMTTFESPFLINTRVFRV